MYDGFQGSICTATWCNWSPLYPQGLLPNYVMVSDAKGTYVRGDSNPLHLKEAFTSSLLCSSKRMKVSFPVRFFSLPCVACAVEHLIVIVFCLCSTQPALALPHRWIIVKSIPFVLRWQLVPLLSIGPVQDLSFLLTNCQIWLSIAPIFTVPIKNCSCCVFYTSPPPSSSLLLLLTASNLCSQNCLKPNILGRLSPCLIFGWIVFPTRLWMHEGERHLVVLHETQRYVWHTAFPARTQQCPDSGSRTQGMLAIKCNTSASLQECASSYQNCEEMKVVTKQGFFSHVQLHYILRLTRNNAELTLPLFCLKDSCRSLLSSYLSNIYCMLWYVSHLTNLCCHTPIAQKRH